MTKELLQFGSEGGSITVFNTDEDFYFNVSEMGYEEFELDPVNRNSETNL